MGEGCSGNSPECYRATLEVSRTSHRWHPNGVGPGQARSGLVVATRGTMGVLVLRGVLENLQKHYWANLEVLEPWGWAEPGQVGWQRQGE